MPEAVTGSLLFPRLLKRRDAASYQSVYICLPPPTSVAKPSVPESQKRAINNTSNFHLAANAFILGDRKSFLTHFTP